MSKKKGLPLKPIPDHDGRSFFSAKLYFGSRLEDKAKLGFWLDGTPTSAVAVLARFNEEHEYRRTRTSAKASCLSRRE